MDADTNEPQPEPRTIRGVNISYRILEAIRELDGAGISEIATHLDHSKSTIHSHLVTLEQNEIVVKEDGRYRLGVRFIDFASQVRDQIGNYDIIREEIDAVAERTGEVAQFGVEEHGRVRYLYQASGAQAVVTASKPGDHSPVHSTGLGKAILAHLPDERVDAILDRRGLPSQTAQTIDDRDELFDELEEVREQGYAIDDEETLEGLRCVAAPVKTDDGLIGAVSISGPSRRFTQERLETDLAKAVQETANVIELNTRNS